MRDVSDFYRNRWRGVLAWACVDCEGKLLREMTSFHQKLWFLEPWLPFSSTLGPMKWESQQGGEGDMWVFFNLIAHSNLMGSLRKVYMSTELLGSSPDMVSRIFTMRPVCLKTDNWDTASLALVCSLDLGNHCIRRCKSPFFMRILITTLGTNG